MNVQDKPPAGFVPALLGGAFATHNGPLFARWHERITAPSSTGSE